MYFVLGCLLDSLAMIPLTIPIVFPIVMRYSSEGANAFCGPSGLTAMRRITQRIARISREGLPANSLEAYVFAAICLATATVVRYGLDWIEGDVLPFVSYFPAIVLTSLISGFGPGMFVAIASTIVRLWTSVPATGADWVNAIFYLLCCASTVWMVHSYRGTLYRLQDSERQIRTLMNELQHRRRNTLAVVQAIISKTLQANSAEAKKINARIGAWLAADQFLTGSDTQSADIKDVLSTALRPYDCQNIALLGPSIALPPDLVRALALVFHELATNAVKYGALSTPAASLSISWRKVGDAVQIAWVEKGVLLAETPTRTGFGTFIFSCLLSKYGGTVATEFRPDGVKCAICFDLPTRKSRSCANTSLQPV